MSSAHIWLGLLLQTIVLGAGVAKVYTAGQVRSALIAQRLARIEHELGIKAAHITGY